jgi:hypothetical protein
MRRATAHQGASTTVGVAANRKKVEASPIIPANAQGDASSGRPVDCPVDC